MAGKIKLNSPRMDSLYASMRQEQQRLEDAAALVSRIAAGLDMDVSARAGIDASLDALRRQLQQQAENMNQMRQLAQLSAAGICEKDEQLANEARGMVYDMRQMLNSASAAGVGAAGAVGTAHGLSPTIPPWSLGAQEESGMVNGFLGMLGGNGLLQPTYPPNEGVNLTGLSTAPLHNLDLHMSAEDWEKTLQNGAFTLLGMGALGTLGTGVLGAAGFFSNTAVASTMGTKKPLTSGGTTKKTGSSSGGSKKEGFFDKVGKTLTKGAVKVSEGLQKGAQTFAKGAEKVTNGVKEILQTKPAQYLIDAGGDILSMGGDITSFIWNYITVDTAGMASDVYGFCNNGINFMQDLEATFSHLAGDLFTALGNEDEAAWWYNEAQIANDANGIAGDFNREGFETLGNIAEGVDTVNNVYKITDGIKSMFESGGKIIGALGEKEWADAGKKIFELSGWKVPKDIAGITTLEAYEISLHKGKLWGDKAKAYKELIGNSNLLYKYATSDEGELLKTAMENTAIGKPFAKLWDLFEKYADKSEELPGADTTSSSAGGRF